MESEKIGIDDLIYKAEIKTKTEKHMCEYQGGKWGGMNLDIGIDIYTLLTPKTDGSWWRGLTKCGPLEKGMANLFSILVLRTP